MIRILILDDDELYARALASRLLREQDPRFAVEIATSPEAARQAVAQAGQPFDIFLIDQLLGPGPDGIQMMQELRGISRESDAIILTGDEDARTGMRAFDAGAQRWVPKVGLNARELIAMLKALQALREMRRERDWLQILTDTAAAAEQGLTLEEVGAAVVTGGRRLGFERVRLWLYSEDGSELIGIHQQGNTGLGDFDRFRMPADKFPYSRRAAECREPVYFHGRELGPSYLDVMFGRHGFQPPVGEWVEIPLVSGQRVTGTLALDNATAPQELRPDQRSFLRLFAGQAAAALERARLYELEQRKSREMAILNQIGRTATGKAAQSNPDSLLEVVQSSVGQLMDASNFAAVLCDEESGQLDVRLWIEQGKRYPRQRLPLSTGMVGYLIRHDVPVLVPARLNAWCRKHGCRPYGKPAKSWLGVPLRVGGRAIGALVVQSFAEEDAYGPDDERLLSAVADQVAGAILAAQVTEHEQERSGRLATLQRASAEMMRLAEEDEDYLWHAALTVATADYGLRFNRAALFLCQPDGALLIGKMGVGHFDAGEAERNWLKDRRQGLDLELYLKRLRAKRLRPTPVEQAVRGWQIVMDGQASAFRAALESGTVTLVPFEQAAERLPVEFLRRFGAADYALVPVRAGNHPLGVVVVDNSHNHWPISAELLGHLQTLLTQAALTWLHLHQRETSDAMLDTSHEIFALAGGRPLRESLQEICDSAQSVCEADCVVIYPLQPSGAKYDTENVVSIGLTQPVHVGDKPRQQGMAAHVIRAGLLAVQDVAKARIRFHDLPLAEQPFLKREKVQAFIGVPLRDSNADTALGVLYISYRTPRLFDRRDVRRVQLFAEQAAIAIRGAQQAKAGTGSQREILNLHSVLSEALATFTDEEKVVKAILEAGRRLLIEPRQRPIRTGTALAAAEGEGDQAPGAEIHVHLHLRGWASSTPNIEPQEVRWKYRVTEAGQVSRELESDLSSGLLGRVWQTRQTQAQGHGQTAELGVPIQVGPHLIGVLHARGVGIESFSAAETQQVERLAQAGALALDNVRRQERLRALLKAARAMTAPADLKETLQAVVDATREAMPGLSCATLWYKEPGTDSLVAGPSFGVLREENRHPKPVAGDTVVARVMKAGGPVWADDVNVAETLRGAFIISERIVSAAALPLVVQDEPVGAIFFNYRRLHPFTPEEQSFFRILAEIAATSLRDARLLEEARQQGRRLEISLGITRVVDAGQGLEQTLLDIIARLRQGFPGATPYVMTYNADEWALEFIPGAEDFYPIDNPQYIGIKRMALSGKSITCRVARNSLAAGQPMLENIGHVHDDPEYVDHIMSTESEVCIGLMSDGRLLGVLEVESNKENAFDHADEEVVRSVARQISLAMAWANRERELRFQRAVATATAWAADIAHDINGQVGYIRNRAYWLEEEPDISPEGRNWAREIDESAAKLKDALSSARVDGEASEASLSVDEVLPRWVSEHVANRAPDVQVSCDLGCPGLEVLAHPEPLRRAVRHLVRNAIEAMQSVGVLTLRTKPAEGRMVEVQIEDTGPGVPDERRALLLTEPGSSKGANRGYGLLLARSAIEGMGGRLRLLPRQPGRGATFAFTLRIKQREEHEEVSDGTQVESR